MNLKIEPGKIKEYATQLKNNIIIQKNIGWFFLLIIFIASLSMIGMENINHPKMEIIVFILLSFLGIICISYYQGHNDDKEFYKTVFIVLLLFGIIF